MLAIDLREDFDVLIRYYQSRIRWMILFQSPGTVTALAGIEGQRNRGAFFVLDVFSKIEAMGRIESPLIAPPRVLIEDIGVTQ